MLCEKKLSNENWAKVVLIAVYVLNRYPTTNLQDIVLQEAWAGEKVNVYHFRIFGSVAFFKYS